KRSKNKVSLFQPLALVDLIVPNTNKGKLQRISEISIHHPYTSIPYHVIKSSIAIFINEIVYKAIKEEDHGDEELFDFIYNSLLLLDLKNDKAANFHIYFMIQLSRYLGFYPQGKYTISTSIFDLREGSFIQNLPSHPHYLTPPYTIFFNDFLNAGHENCEQIKLSKDQRKQLLMALITFYQLHVTSFGEIKSHSILEEVIG
ncbi:MAG: DNA repair protein RecO, partial [Bacteroidota bacterium]